MKKTSKILLAFVLLLGCVFTLTGCDGDKKGGKSKDVTLDFQMSYDYGRQNVDCTVTAPEGYKIVKDGETDEYKFVSGTYAILGNEKYTIEIGKNSYLYHTSTDYQEKYGTKESNFKDYKEYMSSDLRMASLGRTSKELKAGMRDAIMYYNSSARKVYIDIDVDDYSTSFALQLVVIPKEDLSKEEIEKLVDDKTLLEIVTSINVPNKK